MHENHSLKPCQSCKGPAQGGAHTCLPYTCSFLLPSSDVQRHSGLEGLLRWGGGGSKEQLSWSPAMVGEMSPEAGGVEVLPCN